MKSSRSELFDKYETKFLDDFFRENFLYSKIEEIGRYKKREYEDVDKIIQMLNELYLNYESMELFGYNNKHINDNLHFLLLSIQYRLEVRKNINKAESPESFGRSYIDENVDDSDTRNKMKPDLLDI